MALRSPTKFAVTVTLTTADLAYGNYVINANRSEKDGYGGKTYSKDVRGYLSYNFTALGRLVVLTHWGGCTAMINQRQLPAIAGEYVQLGTATADHTDITNHGNGVSSRKAS